MPTHARFSRVLHVASVLALGMTSSIAVAQNGPPPSQTEQQATLNYVSNIAYVGRSEGWTPLPFERFQGLIFFQGTINGEPATILLDNGSSHTALDAGFARRIGLKIRETGKTARTGTGELPLGMAEGVSIDVPHQLNFTTTTGVIDLSAAAAQMKHPVDAVLGADVIAHSALTIVPSRNVLMLVPSGSATPRTDAYSREIPLVSGDQIEAEVNGHPVRLQIDLGSNGVVTLSDAAWNRIFPNDGQPTEGSSTRIEGTNLLTRRTLGNRITFAGSTVEGAPVDSSGPLPGSQDGLLGQGLLERAEIILDIPAKKLIVMRDRKPGDMPAPSAEAKPR